MGLLGRGGFEAMLKARQTIPRAPGAIFGAILGAWKAMLGGYVVHLVAKSAAKSQHERPKANVCSTILISDVF